MIRNLYSFFCIWTLVFCHSEVIGYPAYYASDCTIEKSAATFDIRDKESNNREFYTELFLKLPAENYIGFLLDKISTAHDDDCDMQNPCYEKGWLSKVVVNNVPGYYYGVYSNHFWKRRNPRNPESFYNSYRQLSEVKSCHPEDFDWSSEKIDPEQL